MDTMTISGGKVRTAYATWMRNLTVLAAALGLAGAMLMGGAIVDGGNEVGAQPQQVSELDLFELQKQLGG